MTKSEFVSFSRFFFSISALASLAGKGGSTTPTIMTTFKDDTPDKMVEEEMGAVSTPSQAPLSQLYQIPGVREWRTALCMCVFYHTNEMFHLVIFSFYVGF